MARHVAVGVAAVGAAAVGVFAGVRAVASRVRRDAQAHALDPAELTDTRQHTVRGPKDTLLAVWETQATRDDVPQIVFVHGWMGTHQVWDWVVRALHGDARMVTFDLPFHGQSGAPQADGIDLDFFGDALLSVIDEIVPSGPVVLVGHSLGGMVVLNALRRHEHRLGSRLAASVLISTAASFTDAPTPLVKLMRPVFSATTSPWRERLAHTIGQAVSNAVKREAGVVWLFAAKLQGRRAQPAITHGIVTAMKTAHHEAIAALAPAVLTLDERDGLAVAAGRPVCVIAGADDWLTPDSVTEMLAVASGAEIVTFADVGHVAPKEAADQVAAVIGRYVGLRPRPSASV